jgi:hypothetical protein
MKTWQRGVLVMLWLGAVLSASPAMAKTYGWADGASGGRPTAKELIPTMSSEEAYTERFVFSTDVDGGGHIGVDFTISNLGWGDGHGAASVRVSLPGVKKYTFNEKVDSDDWKYGKDNFSLDIAKTHVHAVGDGTYILKHDGSVKLELTFKSTVPMWRPGTGRIKVDDGYYKFAVIAPRADVSGRVFIGGKWVTIKSTNNGYAEHSATNVAPYELGTRYSRMRTVEGDVFVMWRETKLSKEYGARSYTFVLVTYKDKVVFGDASAKIKFGNVRRDSKTGYAVPLTVQIDGDSGGDSIKMIVEGSKYSRSNLLDSYGAAAKAAAALVTDPYRFSVDNKYTLQMTIQGTTATISGDGRMVFDYVNAE